MGDELRRAFAYLTPYWRRLALVFVISLLSTATTLAVPYLTKDLVDTALIGRDLAALWRIVAAFALLGVFSFALNVVSGLRYTRVSADILFDMRLSLYEHLQRLSPRFYARTRLGDIIARINGDISEIQRVAAEAALAWVGNVLFLCGSVGMMLWLDWRLALVAFSLMPVSLWALVRYRRMLEGRVGALRQRSADIGSFLIETLQANTLIVSANAQSRETARFRRLNDAFVDAVMAMQRITYFAGGLPGVLLSIAGAVVFLYGGSRVINGSLTLGTFGAFLAYQMRVFAPAQALMGLYASLATARVSWHRVPELLDARPTSPSRRRTPPRRGPRCHGIRPGDGHDRAQRAGARRPELRSPSRRVARHCRRERQWKVDDRVSGLPDARSRFRRYYAGWCRSARAQARRCAAPCRAR